MADLPATLPTITRPTLADSFVAGVTAGPTVIDEIADELEILAAMHGITGSAVTTTTDYKVAHGIQAGEVFQTGVSSPAAFTTNQAAMTVAAGVHTLRISGTAARDIQGIDATSNSGRALRLINIGSFTLTLKNQSGTASANNRLALTADMLLGVDEAIVIWYDITTLRWRVSGMGGGTEFLRKTGGTVTGDVLAPTPANPTSVATKSYVDTTAAAAVATSLAKTPAFVQYSAGWPARTTATSDATRMVIWKGPSVSGAGPTIGGAGNAVNGVDVWWEEA